MAHEDADAVAIALNKRFGPGSSFFLGSYQGERLPCWSTGLYALDKAAGGGVPKGRIIEVYGPQASGKTTLALHIIAQVQKKSGLAGFCDAEHALSIELVENMGINIDDLMFSQPDCGEQGLDITLAWVKSGEFGVVVVDSVAALVPRAELDGEMDDQQMGLQARMLGKGIRKINAAASKTDTAVIFINQLRQKIGVMFGNPETTPGGKALEFYASQRYDVRAYKHIKSGKRTIGREGKITLVKNKIAAPFGTVQTKLIFGKGFDAAFDLFQMGLEIGALRKKGNTYAIGNTRIGVGKDATIDSIRMSAKARKKLRIAIKKGMGK